MKRTNKPLYKLIVNDAIPFVGWERYLKRTAENFEEYWFENVVPRIFLLTLYNVVVGTGTIFGMTKGIEALFEKIF
tara:strand:+ start:335 stop:562 length:228 start_codon:yes stop_codon:yes gene_type:complete